MSEENNNQGGEAESRPYWTVYLKSNMKRYFGVNQVTDAQIHTWVQAATEVSGLDLCKDYDHMLESLGKNLNSGFDRSHRGNRWVESILQKNPQLLPQDALPFMHSSMAIRSSG